MVQILNYINWHERWKSWVNEEWFRFLTWSTSTLQCCHTSNLQWNYKTNSICKLLSDKFQLFTVKLISSLETSSESELCWNKRNVSWGVCGRGGCLLTWLKASLDGFHCFPHMLTLMLFRHYMHHRFLFLDQMVDARLTTFKFNFVKMLDK